MTQISSPEEKKHESEKQYDDSLLDSDQEKSPIRECL